ncbi:hypothetical protein LTR16_012800, partial [Cryomyces antarcticus]
RRLLRLRDCRGARDRHHRHRGHHQEDPRPRRPRQARLPVHRHRHLGSRLCPRDRHPGDGRLVDARAAHHREGARGHQLGCRGYRR